MCTLQGWCIVDSSPVMTQKAWRRLNASTILTLVVGLHRARTSGREGRASISSSDSLSKS